jgi:hypothetical protein
MGGFIDAPEALCRDVKIKAESADHDQKEEDNERRERRFSCSSATTLSGRTLDLRSRRILQVLIFGGPDGVVRFQGANLLGDIDAQKPAVDEQKAFRVGVVAEPAVIIIFQREDFIGPHFRLVRGFINSQAALQPRFAQSFPDSFDQVFS